ncbi:hypothetical protein CAAN1_32S00760 [[Candida] anglica]|uniref:Cyclin n=1 Tax=[Candida] anglica TaxID=148631 RepID=A0ABP0EAI0_9ASCO
MSLIERVSPFLSPGSRCGYWGMEGVSTDDNDPRGRTSEEHYIYSYKRMPSGGQVNNSTDRSSTSSTRSTSNSRSLVYEEDDFLSQYLRPTREIKRKPWKVTDPFFERYVQPQMFKRLQENNKHKIPTPTDPFKRDIQPGEQKEPQREYLRDYKGHDQPAKTQPRSSPLVNSVTSNDENTQVEPKDSFPVTENITSLPKDFADCSIDHIITLISRMLRQLILLNDGNVPKSISNPEENAGSSSSSSSNKESSASHNGNGSLSGTSKPSPVLTRYHSRTPPSISIPTYLNRLTKFNNFTTATLLTTIYYIDLLSHHYQPFFTLNSWTVHRFLLVGTMLSQKSMEDFFYTNDHYAKVGGVAVSELNCLELDFLTRVDWRCVPAKQLDNNRSSIKYAKDVLDLYYSQLIQLMGRNVSSGDETVFEAEPEEVEDVDVDEDEDREEDEDDYDSEDEDMDEYETPQTYAPEEKFNSFGYSVDGSSSPHLKRRYPP